MKQRVEEKYLCNAKDLAVLQSRLRVLCPPDAHVNSQGEYTIKSLYLDDHFNSCYFDNEDGVERRSKYRIRMYNNDPSTLHLEVKTKNQRYIHKDSYPLTQEQTKDILRGKWHLPPTHLASVQTTLKAKLQQLKPVVTVEYVREPYIYKDGNVRITLDKHITASHMTHHFLQSTTAKVPLLESGQWILEVKYDEFLPTHLYNALGLKHMTQIAFSKYYLSRTMLKQTFYTQKRVIK